MENVVKTAGGLHKTGLSDCLFEGILKQFRIYFNWRFEWFKDTSKLPIPNDT